MPIFTVLVFALVLLWIIALFMGIKVVKENQRMAVFRFGKFMSVRPPGLSLIIPFIDKAEFIDLNVELPGWSLLPAQELDEKIRERILSRALG